MSYSGKMVTLYDAYGQRGCCLEFSDNVPKDRLVSKAAEIIREYRDPGYEYENYNRNVRELYSENSVLVSVSGSEIRCAVTDGKYRIISDGGLLDGVAKLTQAEVDAFLADPRLNIPPYYEEEEYEPGCLESLGISMKAVNALKKHGIFSVDALKEVPEADFSSIFSGNEKLMSEARKAIG